jgi:hypothetical protein
MLFVRRRRYGCRLVIDPILMLSRQRAQRLPSLAEPALPLLNLSRWFATADCDVGRPEAGQHRHRPQRHHPSGIALLTPADLHYGRAAGVIIRRHHPTPSSGAIIRRHHPAPSSGAIIRRHHPAPSSGAIIRRQAVLDAAYRAHPVRFVNKPPVHPEAPIAVWINKPAAKPGNNTQ